MSNTLFPFIQDEVDHRGRWKNTRRIQDVYTDVHLPYIDAKVASVMCKGGAAAYILNDASGISEEWVLQHIVPHMVDYGIHRQVCLVLGRAVLWALFDPTQASRIPQHRRQQMMQAYAGLGDRNTLAAGENPVLKRSLVIVGQDAEVVMDLMSDEDGGGGGGGSLSLTLAQRNQEVRMLSSQVLQLRHELVDSRAEHECQLAVLRRRLGRIDNNVARITNRPARQLRLSSNTVPGPPPPQQRTSNTSNTNETQAAEEETPMETEEDVVRAPVLIAKLGKCPKTLHDLWHEYVFGMAGYKAAKDFTRAERGNCRHTYSRRNAFWARAAEMVRMGYSAERAIDKIYAAYGNKSVTDILNLMMKDRKAKVVRVGLSDPPL